MSAISGSTNSYNFPLTFLNQQRNVSSPSDLVQGTGRPHHAEGSESAESGSESASGSEGSVDVMA